MYFHPRLFKISFNRNSRLLKYHYLITIPNISELEQIPPHPHNTSFSEKKMHLTYKTLYNEKEGFPPSHVKEGGNYKRLSGA